MSEKEKVDTEAQQIEALGASQEEDLDSIMQELESLDSQREPAQAAEPAAAPSPVAAAKTEASPTSASAPVSLRPAKAPAKKAGPGGAIGQSLTLELSGTLNLKLAFVTGSRSVELICTDEALVCRFGDGTEVRIPTENPRGATFRRSA